MEPPDLERLQTSPSTRWATAQAGPSTFGALPDLRIADEETPRLWRALLAAHVELLLRPGGVAIHESLLDDVRQRLGGRSARVWQEADRFKASFGVFSRAEQEAVDALAYGVAQRLGARVVFSTTVRLVVPADADFLR